MVRANNESFCERLTAGDWRSSPRDVDDSHKRQKDYRLHTADTKPSSKRTLAARRHQPSCELYVVLLGSFTLSPFVEVSREHCLLGYCEFNSLFWFQVYVVILQDYCHLG